MTHNHPTNHPARSAFHPTRPIALAGLAVIGATLVGVLSCQSPVTSPPSTAWHRSATSPGDGRRAVDVAGGAVPDGTTVFDDGVPAVAGLDPALLGALRRAARDAADDRITFHVNSGRRSRGYQDRLLREAVGEYGSREEAARWVATADTSPHVSGDAVDLGDPRTTAWLSAHGAGYGLCQIYRNEPWHYELRPEAPKRGCPPLYADAGQDPRLRR